MSKLVLTYVDTFVFLWPSDWLFYTSVHL